MVPDISDVVVVLEHGRVAGNIRVGGLDADGANIETGGRLGAGGLVGAGVLADVWLDKLRQILGAERVIRAPSLAPALAIWKTLVVISPIHGNREANLLQVIEAIDLLRFSFGSSQRGQ